MAKKTNIKPDEIVNNQEQVEVLEKEPVEVKAIDSYEVILKIDERNKNTHVVFLERGKYVEFHQGKAVVNASTKAKLEEIGVI